MDRVFGRHREEEGALADVARFAEEWFTRYLLHSSRRWSGPRLEERYFRNRAEACRLLAGSSAPSRTGRRPRARPAPRWCPGRL
jgi:hypothetical protein